MADFEDRVVAPKVCWLQQPYNGTQDYDTEYLGFKQLPVNATVNLTAFFDTNEKAAEFLDWWRDELTRGTKIFVLEDVILFAKMGTYGLRQTAPLKHTVSGTNNKITLSAEIVFSADIDNKPPKAFDSEVYLETDSRDNFITLQGTDPDGDNLTFKVLVPPAKVENNGFNGSPPNLLYTPLKGYVGDDCFSFTVTDKYGKTDTGVVAIHVAKGVKPAFTAEYTIDMTNFPHGIRMGGNYWWNEGVGEWKRGTGGYLKPNTDADPANDKILIASNDNFVDDRDVSGVLGINILNWGNRTNLYHFASLPECVNFSIDGNSGASDKVVSVEGMFTHSKITTLPAFDTSSVTNFKEFLSFTQLSSIPSFDFSSGLDFASMLESTVMTNLPTLNTGKGEIFDRMFKNSKVICMPSIDTRNKLSTAGMFKGSSIENVSITSNPDSGIIPYIEGGHYWSNVLKCGVEATTVTQESVGTCDIATIDGKCKSQATYKAHYRAGTPATPVDLTYTWFADAPATIVSSNGDTAVIESGDSDKNVNITISCTITDNTSGKASNTGVYSFTHLRTTSYATLQMDVNGGDLQLTKWIKARTSKTEIVITNNHVRPKITVGDLDGLTHVKFINNGELQGASSIVGFEALNLSKTPANKFQLINNGWIRGGGGHGGTGGKGANDTYQAWSLPFPSLRYKFVSCHGNASDEEWMGQFRDSSSGKLQTIVYINGKLLLSVAEHSTKWYSLNATTQYRRGTLMRTVQCSYPTNIYRLEYRVLETHTRIGGAGGAGGIGQGYNQINQGGQPGQPSSPAGGHSGGRGGTGGTWGVAGNTGGNGGSVGTAGGKAIKGTSKLLAGSKIGNINGGISS